MKPQRTTRRSPILRIYAAFVFAFIYLPIVVLVVYFVVLQIPRF